MKKLLKQNRLSITFIVLFLFSMTGQFYTGMAECNKEQLEEGQPSVSASSYIGSGHFMQATFENWESEFLQMALFVMLTIALRQKGSSESKKCDELEEVDREPSAKRKDAPWPVRRGGWILAVYKHSLSITLCILFILSFVLHFCGSFKDENHQLAIKGLPPETWSVYLRESRFWFESFQNWQSEFLSVFAIVYCLCSCGRRVRPNPSPWTLPIRRPATNSWLRRRRSRFRGMENQPVISFNCTNSAPL